MGCTEAFDLKFVAVVIHPTNRTVPATEFRHWIARHAKHDETAIPRRGFNRLPFHRHYSAAAIEEAQEDQQTRRIAAALGITYEELDGQEWSIDADVGNDDMVYGYIVTLENGQTAQLTPDQVE